MNTKNHKRPKYLIFLVFFILYFSTLACAEYPGIPRQLSGNPSNSSSSTSGSQTFANRTVEIELRDFELYPDDFTVPAGEITFKFNNMGRYTHDFRIEGNGVDEKSPRVAAGRSDEWIITLAPGTYNISCPISNHADRGMVGTLTVTP